MPASRPPLRSDAASRLSRSGRCIPTVSISIAKPISPRNEIVPLAGFTASSTAGPDEDAGEDLADHDGHEPASTHAEQRPAEAGQHDHKQRLEAHGLSLCPQRHPRLR